MPLTAMAKRCGVLLCNQRCKTRVYIKDGIVYEAMSDAVHRCPMAQRAREFEGYYNMIQINTIKPKIESIHNQLVGLRSSLNELMSFIEYVEEQNKPLAEEFKKRKQRVTITAAPNKPMIKIASELLTK